MISFVIPAHNEEALIGRTLAALQEAARGIDEPYEIIVASDASTDRTADIAREHGARVVEVDHRQIAATRNSGARAAAGDVFIFVDADTQARKPAIRAALRMVRSGAVGGGCLVRYDQGRVPIYAVVIERGLRLLGPVIGLAGGCFFYCTRAAFHAAGGFDETLFAAEEVALAAQLKRLGRFVVLSEYVITSARKVRVHSVFEVLRIFIRIAISGRKSLQQREGLEFWYGPREPHSTS